MTPEELWQQAIQGHQPSWNRLFELFGSRLYQFFLKNTGDPEMANDKTQEVFMRLYMHRTKFSYGQLKTWIFRIARNLLVDAWRRKGKSDIPTDQLPEPRQTNPGLEEQVIESIDRRNMVSLLDETLALLQDQDRMLLGLVYLGGLSFPELALVMEIPLGTAKTQVRQARLRLDRLIQERLPTQEQKVVA